MNFFSHHTFCQKEIAQSCFRMAACFLCVRSFRESSSRFFCSCVRKRHLMIITKNNKFRRHRQTSIVSATFFIKPGSNPVLLLVTSPSKEDFDPGTCSPDSLLHREVSRQSGEPLRQPQDSLRHLPGPFLGELAFPVLSKWRCQYN